MSLEVFINKFSTTLNGSINSTVTTITLTSVSGLPTAGNCRLKIEDEILIITLNGSTTVLAYRGGEFTTAASHADVTPCYILLTAGALNQARAEFYNYDVSSNRGVNGNIGRWFRDSDGTTVARDNGSSWDNFGWAPPYVIPISLGSFAAYGFAATTATNKKVSLFANSNAQYLYSTTTSSNTDQVGCYLTALPSSTTDWTAIVGLQHNISHAHVAHGGLIIYESSSGKATTWGPYHSQGVLAALSANFTISNSTATTATCTKNSTNFSTACHYQNDFIFYMIKYIHTESTTAIRLFESVDGINWAFVLQQTFSGLTFPSHVGFYLDYYTGTNALSLYGGFNVFHWSLTQP
jgi:hypothetical protein